VRGSVRELRRPMVVEGEEDMEGLDLLREELRSHSDLKRAESAKRFFKTGPGEYGYGDVFIGVPVPALRTLASRYRGLNRENGLALMRSPVHEERALALMILIHQFKNGSPQTQHDIFSVYLSHTAYINNWDLVDLSAEHIVGAYLEERPKDILYHLAQSLSLWERRIAILATFRYIKKSSHQETLQIAEMLLPDKHDLIQKAVGWMLREVGKRCSQELEEGFLRKHYRSMGRTALRYAIERFPDEKRRAYLKGGIE
jgi:3-methyladenine DNA glycosylase AlkD